MLIDVDATSSPRAAAVGQLSVGLALDLGRRGEVGVAHHHEHLPADRRRGNRRLRAGARSDLHEPRAEARGVDGRHERLAEQRVDDDVDPAPGGRGQRARQVIWLAEANGGVRAEREAALQPFGRTRRGDHTRRAEQLRGLHGDLSQHAAGAQHEHVLALL